MSLLHSKISKEDIRKGLYSSILPFVLAKLISIVSSLSPSADFPFQPHRASSIKWMKSARGLFDQFDNQWYVDQNLIPYSCYRKAYIIYAGKRLQFKFHLKAFSRITFQIRETFSQTKLKNILLILSILKVTTRIKNCALVILK